MRIKKFLCAGLILALLLTQVAGAFATEGTVAGPVAALSFENPLLGKELRNTLTLDWHGFPMMDEQSNKAISALLNTLTISGRSAQLTETEGYGEFLITMQGQEAVTFQYVTKDDAAYFVSPSLPQPIVLKAAEADVLAENLMAYLAEAYEIPVEAMEITQMAQPAVDFEKVIAAMDQEQVEAIGEAFLAWTEAMSEKGELLGQPTETMLGIDATDATVYQITEADVREMMAIFYPIFTGFDAYWTEVYGVTESMMGEEAMLDGGMTLESFLEVVRSIPEELDASLTFPEGMVAYAVEYMDAQKNYSGYAIQFSIPATETDPSSMSVYIEGTPSGDGFYAMLQADDQTIVLNISCPHATADSQSASALLEVYEGEELFAQAGLEFAQTITTEPGKETRKGQLALVFADQTMQAAVQLPYTVSMASADGRETTATTLDVNLAMGEEVMPIVTVKHFAEIIEPTEAPFDPADPELDFLNPAEMTSEDFTHWVNDQLMMSMLQTVFRVLSVIPEEVLAMFMPEMTMNSASPVTY